MEKRDKRSRNDQRDSVRSHFCIVRTGHNMQVLGTINDNAKDRGKDLSTFSEFIIFVKFDVSEMSCT